MTEKTLEEQLGEAFDEHTEGAQDPADIVEKPEEPIKQEVEEPAVEEPQDPEAQIIEEKPAIDPPQAWTAEAKKDWAALPPHIQAEIIKRENDTHKMFTAREGELRLGREMKDVIEPYMPLIKEAGAEPKALIHDLLGTVNTLRNGTEEQKIMVMRNIAEGYGVDLQKVMGYQQNPLNQLYAELNGLKQQLNPQAIINQLQERQEADRIANEYKTFAENPKNVHLDKVKPFMAALLESGQAKDFQEAYDMACYAIPEIRSTMLNSVKADEAAKRKMEVTQKKNAAVSVKGSSSVVQGNTTPQKRTIEEEIAASFDAVLGSKI